MSYRFLDDIAIADAAFEVEAGTLSDLFTQAAEALLQVQIDNIDQVRPDQTVPIGVSHPELDLLLYRFLQELIYLKDTRRLLLKVRSIDITRKDGTYLLRADAVGEGLDASRHHQRADVKAVTLYRFKVTPIPTGYRATVVLDI